MRAACKPYIGTILTVTLACVSWSVSAVEERHENGIEDLAVGTSLYQYFQDNNLAAITEIQVAKQRRLINNAPEDAELLLAGLYYDYGLADEADAIYQRLLKEEIPDNIKDRVWFNLARVQYADKQYRQAGQLLSRIRGELLPQQEAQRQYMLSSLYLREQHFAQAQAAANQIDPDQVWSAYSQYNLGVSLTAADKPAEGYAWLNRLVDADVDDEERLALQDAARLALGVNALRQTKFEQAIDSFGGVRVDGPLSNRALLGAGWAWSKQSQPEKALTYWQVLQDKQQQDVATQEASLAIAFAFEQMRDKKRSADYYDRAVQSYERQLHRMDDFVDNIKHTELIAVLSEQTGRRVDSGGEHDAVKAALYDYEIIADPSFQLAWENYRELQTMLSMLSTWKKNIPVLQLNLTERKHSFDEKRAILSGTTRYEQLRQLQKQRNRLAAQLKAIKQSDDALALADEDERDYLEQLDEVKQLLDKVADKQDVSDQMQRYKLLYGLLYWDIKTDYVPRFWQVASQLKALDRELGKARSSAESLQRASTINARKLNDISGRISGQTAEISRLENTVERLIAKQQQRLTALAIAVVEQRRQQLAQLRLNARYSLTRLVDEIAIQAEQQ